MTVRIMTPESVLFEGNAEGVKLPGTSGSFEILNNHAAIMASLEKGSIRVKHDGKDTSFDIQDGFVECLNNHINNAVTL